MIPELHAAPPAGPAPASAAGPSSAPANFPARRFAWIGEALPQIAVSFEFFPPKTPAGEKRLQHTVAQLTPLAPRYVSVTCGAGGNLAAGTGQWVEQLRAGGLAAAAHLTCASLGEIGAEAVARAYWQSGIRHLVALRGDAPKAAGDGTPARYAYADDLVRALRAVADFEISVAAYPETHPEALSPQADLDHLKRKIDAGASRAITQYCFDTDAILRFRDRIAAAGITAPLAIGILPVHDFAQVKRFSEGCGASIPAWLGQMFEGLDNDPEQRAAVSASIAAEQARRLIVEGLQELHFYTLNRAELTVATCRLLGLRPRFACAA